MTSFQMLLAPVLNKLNNFCFWVMSTSPTTLPCGFSGEWKELKTLEKKALTAGRLGRVISLDSSGFTLEGSWGSTGDPSDLLLARGKKRGPRKIMSIRRCWSSVLSHPWDDSADTSLTQILKHICEKTVNIQANKISHTHLGLSPGSN